MLIPEAFIDCTLTFFKCSVFVRDLIIGQCGTSLLMLVLVIPENSVKELLRAPGTIKDRIKKLLAHKNSMRKKVKMKNITEPRGTPTTKVDSEPFSSEESISRDGNPHGEKNRNENRKKERLEDEKRDENHVEQEQSLHGDVFCEYQV